MGVLLENVLETLLDESHCETTGCDGTLKDRRVSRKEERRSEVTPMLASKRQNVLAFAARRGHGCCKLSSRSEESVELRFGK